MRSGEFKAYRKLMKGMVVSTTKAVMRTEGPWVWQLSCWVRGRRFLVLLNAAWNDEKVCGHLRSARHGELAAAFIGREYESAVPEESRPGGDAGAGGRAVVPAR